MWCHHLVTKCFSYLRVSSVGQVDGDGFPRQREKIDAYCRAHDLVVEREFRDEGVSGTKEMSDRPGLKDLMVAIELNGVRTVLVERADRLARDLMVGELILKEFREMKPDDPVRVIAVDTGTELTIGDTGDPTKVLIRQLLGALAQWEKTSLVQKLRAARERIRKGGVRCEGGPPFGIVEDEKAIVARMLELRGQNKTLSQIADVLNAEGHRTKRNGCRWHRTSVTRVLRRHVETHAPVNVIAAPTSGV
jgi:DNA invertase Pin-like site-specific DNA recombinase